jgi:hypothetical protein
MSGWRGRLRDFTQQLLLAAGEQALAVCPQQPTPGTDHPGKRGKGHPARALGEHGPTPRHLTMTWAQRLKRVFHIDIETCSQCGGAMKVIACIEDPAVIQKILEHLKATTFADTPVRPESRAPPQADLFDAR